MTVEAWLDVATVAHLLPDRPTPRHVRRLAKTAFVSKYEGRKLKISVDSLPAAAQAAWRLAHPDLPMPLKPLAEVPDVPVYSFENASPRQQETATRRLTAVVEYEIFLAEWGDRRGLWAAKDRWAKSYTIRSGFKVSADTLDRLLERYRAFGRDGLVDGNDGRARRGKSVIPRRVRDAFIARKTDGTDPTIAEVIDEMRTFFGAMGTDLSHIADDAFRRIHIPEALLRSTGKQQDAEERVIYTLRRRHDFPALKIVVADHHLTDRWVHCGAGGYVFAAGKVVKAPAARICEGECKHGHRVWITAFMDVSSRTVLSWVVSLDYPRADTVRRALKQLIVRRGLPEIVYVDNGKDFKSAFGRAIRRGEAVPLPDNVLGNLLASLGIRVIFAIPRRARSKSIERLFRTWCMQIWQGRAEYVGSLGKRTEAAKKLYREPWRLLSLEEFHAELDLRIDLYNLHEHGGQGMNGRAPLEVFDLTRIPRRDPEPNGFALAFWTWYGRQVHAGGTVQVGPDRYVLDPIVAANVMGQKVQVLVDPEDVHRARIFSGCEHTDSKTSRAKTLTCSCSGKGLLLCEAKLDSLATYVDPQVTADDLREADAINRELMREVRRHRTPAAIRDVKLMKRSRGALLMAIRDRKRAAHVERVAAAGGGAEPVIAMLPTSHAARQISELREQLSAPRFTAEEAALAASVELPTSDEMIEMGAFPPLELVIPAATEETSAGAAVDLEQLAIEGQRREREAAGFCSATLDCPFVGDPFCATHAKELLGE